MIDPIKNPKCFSAFNSARKTKEPINEAKTSVKLASIAGSGLFALGAAHLIAKGQSAKLKRHIGMFGVKYEEPELIGLALASVAGGLLAGGISDDKKYFPLKVKEAIHQATANVLAPLLLISGLNKIYDKYEIKNLPKFSDNSGLKKVVNETIKMAPRLAIALVGLIGGVSLGTIIANKINRIDNTEHERKVKFTDYLYHPDDFAAAAAVADKKGLLQKFVSKIIPPIFMLHGYDTGTRR